MTEVAYDVIWLTMYSAMTCFAVACLLAGVVVLVTVVDSFLPWAKRRLRRVTLGLRGEGSARDARGGDTDAVEPGVRAAPGDLQEVQDEARP